jgi:hypothetical protein
MHLGPLLGLKFPSTDELFLPQARFDVRLKGSDELPPASPHSSEFELRLRTVVEECLPEQEVVDSSKSLKVKKPHIYQENPELVKRIINSINEGKTFKDLEAELVSEGYPVNKRSLESCYVYYCSQDKRKVKKFMDWNEENLGLLRAMVRAGKTKKEIAEFFNNRFGTTGKPGSFAKIITMHGLGKDESDSGHERPPLKRARRAEV